jgi:hypothetical protein
VSWPKGRKNPELSKCMSGENNPFFWKETSRRSEVREKISKANTATEVK